MNSAAWRRKTVWLAWDGGSGAVVGCDDGRGGRAGSIAIFAAPSDAAETAETLLDAFPVTPAEPFLRPLTLPPDTGVVRVVFRNHETSAEIAHFRLASAPPADATHCRFVYLVERRAGDIGVVSRILPALPGVQERLAHIAAGGPPPLWGVRIACVQNPGAAEGTSVLPSELAFPNNDQVVEVRAESYKREFGDVADLQDEPTVLVAALEREPFHAELTIDVPVSDDYDGDPTSGILVVHILRQRVVFDLWREGQFGRVTMPSVDLEQIVAWLGHPPSHLPSDPKRGVTAELQPTRGTHGDAPGPIEISLVDASSRTGGLPRPVKRYQVRFNAASRGDHLLVVDIEDYGVGRLRLAGSKSGPVSHVIFRVDAARLEPLEVPFERLYAPPYDILWTAPVALKTDPALDAGAGPHAGLRQWMSRVAGFDGTGMPPFRLRPLYVCAYAGLSASRAQAGPRGGAVEVPGFASFETDPPLAALLAGHSDLAETLKTAAGGPMSVRKAASPDIGHLADRTLRAFGIVGAFADDLGPDGQISAYELVADPSKISVLRRMLGARVTFDAGVRDLAEFGEIAAELTSLSADQDVVETAEGFGGREAAQVRTYLDNRNAGRFTARAEAASARDVLHRAELLVRQTLDMVDGPSRKQPEPHVPPVVIRISAYQARAVFDSLVAQALASNDPQIAAEGRRLRGLAQDGGKPPIFYRRAVDNLRRLLDSPERSAELDALLETLHSWAIVTLPHVTHSSGRSMPADPILTRRTAVATLVQRAKSGLDVEPRGEATPLGRNAKTLADAVARRCESIRKDATDQEADLFAMLPDYARLLMLHKAFGVLSELHAGEDKRAAHAISRELSRLLNLWPVYAERTWERHETWAEAADPSLASRMRKAIEPPSSLLSEEDFRKQTRSKPEKSPGRSARDGVASDEATYGSGSR